MRSFAALCLLLLGTACGRAGDDTAALSDERDRAIASGDRLGATYATLDLDEALELAQPSEAPWRIKRRYELLRGMVEGEAALRDERDPVLPIAYDPRELEAVRKVFTRFGGLYLAPGDPVEVKTPTMPWAGYWYPLSGTDIFGGPDSPFAKLDRLAGMIGTGGGVVAAERQAWQGSHAQGWEGFCAAWSVAAIHAPEPTKPLTLQNVTFSISDQKALLTRVHELYPAEVFGIRYRGGSDTDGTFQDLRPEAFQQLVMKVVGEQGKAFAIDDEPGVEVWSKPLYRMRWTVKRDPQRPNALLVTAFPWVTRQRAAIDEGATGVEDALTYRYEYRLYTDPSQTVGGKELVIAGEWLNDSRDFHPDYAALIGEGNWGSTNAALNASLDVVRRLFQSGS